MTASAHRWIALLRGVNVGGRNRVGMADLRRALEERGFDPVRTLIQSGNIVLGSAERRPDAVVEAVGDGIERGFGFRPAVVLLSVDALRDLLARCPYPADPDRDGRLTHFYLAAEAPAAPDLDALRGLASETESVTLEDRVLYLHAPDGIGRSRLVPKIERCIGAEMTGRNLNTMLKLLALAEEA